MAHTHRSTSSYAIVYKFLAITDIVFLLIPLARLLMYVRCCCILPRFILYFFAVYFRPHKEQTHFEFACDAYDYLVS